MPDLIWGFWSCRRLGIATTVGKLSGGQKARLALAIVMWEKPHVLILDEPTNHLDMDSIRALATGLNDFQGAVLLVSHNQGFLSNVCHELWSVNHGKVKVTVGIEKARVALTKFSAITKIDNS